MTSTLIRSILIAAGRAAVQSARSADGRTVWRYTADGEVLIDRFINGVWKTFGPYPK